ncbi:putative protein tyrosine phosphatase [Tieghemostelium lacteum]|uniref:UDENN domain-containing protein n=1 Tax=Tieghemostelium lacteum TaxID=361077 RepID=A0A151ZRP8_TIELA|nr:putative protein tyrosine phosphatase [Tieghemostelium lacteum]|eukprot:KYQ96701.1 putative protein tyrosine phosphatase [Tieghemostelium lacteum]
MSDLLSYIGIVGFHHQHGHRLEFIYPPISNQDLGMFDWNYLNYAALPDGCHNSNEDYCFFVMNETNPTTVPSNKLYGIAYFKQKAIKDLPSEAISIDDTRSTIQKSVVVLSNFPIFYSFKTQLSSATICYFNQGDFKNTEILVNWFNNKNKQFREDNNLYLEKRKENKKPENEFTTESLQKQIIPIQSDLFFSSSSLQKFLLHFGRNSLVFFKLLMLERGVLVFCPQPVNAVCETVLSVLSLFPKSFDLFVQQNHSVCSDYHIEWSQDTDKEHLEQIRKFQLPLPIFTSKGTFCQPYLPLQHSAAIIPDTEHPTNGQKGYLVGTSNNLYLKSPPSTCHAIVDIQSGEILFRDESLHRILELTSFDRRFIDHIIDTVQEVYTNPQQTGYIGTDKWLRDQFAYYILCLLNSLSKTLRVEDGKAIIDNIDSLSTFNEFFIRKWSGSRNFHLWRNRMFKQYPNSLPHFKSLPNHPSGPPSDIIDNLQDSLVPITNSLSKVFSSFFNESPTNTPQTPNSNNNSNNNFYNASKSAVKPLVSTSKDLAKSFFNYFTQTTSTTNSTDQKDTPSVLKEQEFFEITSESSSIGVPTTTVQVEQTLEVVNQNGEEIKEDTNLKIIQEFDPDTDQFYEL